MNRATLCALTAALACGLAAAPAAQKNKTTCGSDVPVTVSIAGSHGFDGADPLGNALVSDGGGNYANSPRGSDKITAIFQVNNCTFDFTMNLNFSRRSMWALLDTDVRRGNFFNFDRVGSVPVTTAVNFLSSTFCTTQTLSRNPDGSIPGPLNAPLDNYAGCGADSYGNYVLRGGGVSLDPDERLGFARSPLDMNESYPCAPTGPGTDPVCQASYIKVYHPNSTTWVLRPEDIAQAVYRVWDSGAYLLQGYRTVPFEITVTTP